MAGRHRSIPKTGIADKESSNHTKAYNATGANVLKEAKKRKRGGRAMEDCRATGGAISAPRLDRRARGGRAQGGGADKNPFSSAGAGLREWAPKRT